MKTIILFVFLLSLAIYPLSSEIVSWKGMELGKEETPSWFTEYVNHNNDRLIRKKFSLTKKDVIYYGYGQSTSKQNALYESESDALKKCTNKNSDTFILSGFTKLVDFWQKDDKGIFHYHSFYVLPTSSS